MSVVKVGVRVAGSNQVRTRALRVAPGISQSPSKPCVGLASFVLACTSEFGCWRRLQRSVGVFDDWRLSTRPLWRLHYRHTAVHGGCDDCADGGAPYQISADVSHRFVSPASGYGGTDGTPRTFRHTGQQGKAGWSKIRCLSAKRNALSQKHRGSEARPSPEPGWHTQRPSLRPAHQHRNHSSLTVKPFFLAHAAAGVQTERATPCR